MTRRSKPRTSALARRSPAGDPTLAKLSPEDHALVVQLQARLARDLGAWLLYRRGVEVARAKGDTDAIRACTAKRESARQRRDHTRGRLTKLIGTPAVGAFESALMRDPTTLEIVARADGDMSQRAAQATADAAAWLHTREVRDPTLAALALSAWQSIGIGRAYQDRVVVTGDADLGTKGRTLLTEGERALARIESMVSTDHTPRPIDGLRWASTPDPLAGVESDDSAPTGEQSTEPSNDAGDGDSDLDDAGDDATTGAVEVPGRGLRRAPPGVGGRSQTLIKTGPNPPDANVTRVSAPWVPRWCDRQKRYLVPNEKDCECCENGMRKS